MRASLVLAKSAVIGDHGRIDLIDAGWNTIRHPGPFVVVTLIVCPAELCGTDHKMRIDLLDEHSEAIGKPIAKSRKFRADPPRGAPAGSAVAVAPMVDTIADFDHPPGRYALRLSINGMADDGWFFPVIRARGKA
jgi:hypothetical protein